MATERKTYQGWTNYETWCIKLWIDNEQPTYEYWREEARDAWANAGPNKPNQFIDSHKDNAVAMLARQLKSEFDDANDDPRLEALNGTFYADLLTAALSEVNWHEIAASMIEDEDLE
jgi:hypothetical protein